MGTGARDASVSAELLLTGFTDDDDDDGGGTTGGGIEVEAFNCSWICCC